MRKIGRYLSFYISQSIGQWRLYKFPNRHLASMQSKKDIKYSEKHLICVSIFLDETNALNTSKSSNILTETKDNRC